uniref:TPR repeat-containing protein n=1 Tax=Strongyloides papillosus TaxID=174720 RepID=A0A0N5B512_STREA
MNSTKFVRFLSNSRSILLRAGNKQNYSHNGSRKFGNHFTKMAIGTGTTGTLLGLSFWGSSKNDDDKSRFSAVPSANKELKNLELIIRETDALYNNYLIDNAYAILKKHAKGTNSELLWRLARVLCEKGKLSKDKEERKTFFMQAYETCKKA